MSGRREQPLEALLLDLDGTLLCSQEMDLLSLQQLLREEFGVEPTDAELHGFLGQTSRQILATYDPDRVEPLLTRWLEIQEELRHLAYLYPGINAVLPYLRDCGLKLAVVTAQNARELAASRECVDLEEWIEAWVCSDDATPKPAAAPLLLALEELGVKPAAAMMIGDTAYDMEAGRNAGIRLGAALWGTHDPDALLAYDPEFVFHEPKELEKLCLSKKR